MPDEQARIRYSPDGTIVIIQDPDGDFHVASQEEMDTLEVGDDLSEEEIETLDL